MPSSEAAVQLGAEETLVYDALHAVPQSMDEVIRVTGLAASQVTLDVALIGIEKLYSAVTGQ